MRENESAEVCKLEHARRDLLEFVAAQIEMLQTEEGIGGKFLRYVAIGAVLLHIFVGEALRLIREFQIAGAMANEETAGGGAERPGGLKAVRGSLQRVVRLPHELRAQTQRIVRARHRGGGKCKPLTCPVGITQLGTQIAPR